MNDEGKIFEKNYDLSTLAGLNHKVSKAQSISKIMLDSSEKKREAVAKEVVDIAVKVHRQLGPGLLESVYEKCFCHDLAKRGIPFRRQLFIDVVYDGDLVVSEALKIDILVNDDIIIELKAQETYNAVWEAQLLSYLKLSKRKLGFLINFHVPLMKNGIKRMIL